MSDPSHDGVRLRRLRSADLPAVALLQDEVFGADRWTLPALRDELAADPARRRWVVAEVDGRVGGAAGARYAGDVADVLTVVVDPGHRRRGAGRALLGDLLCWARSTACARVLLEVAADNEPALTLYARAGFTELSRRPGYYAGGRDALVLEKVL